MITAKTYDDLKSLLDGVSTLDRVDDLGSKILTVGLGHLNALKYTLKSKNKLTPKEQAELEILVVNFGSIVVDYLAEKEAA
jgi:hypothetical protein